MALMASNTPRSLACAVVVLTLCLSATMCSSAFLAARKDSHSSRTVATSEVETELRLSLEEALSGGRGAVAHRLEMIEKSTWQTYQSLPKNEYGRLGPRAVRYVVHNYFAKEHGWLIQGLEPHGMRSNVSEVHEVSILQDKAPALVEALLEARQADRGLALNDVVAMIAALERLIFDESMELLDAAYHLNGVSTTAKIDSKTVHEVLRSYLLVFGGGSSSDLTDAEKHGKLKAALADAKSYEALMEYESDTKMNVDFANRHQINPFAPQSYSFAEAGRIAEEMTQGYGQWQNAECREMKAALMDIDLEGKGRVPLGKFYAQPEEATYQFSESVDYLRQTGALDETGRGGPQVLIANYLAGPTNCIATSSYYSICCISECEGLMNELEHKIQAPTASAQRLTGLVSSMSSSSVDAPRVLDRQLSEKLSAIAEHHNGEVPIHGRLFAQWLHFAFPNECPLPQVTENAAVLTPNQWLDESATASQEERSTHMEASATEPVESEGWSEEHSHFGQWSHDEVLPVLEQSKAKSGVLGRIVRVGMQIAVLVVLLNTAVAAFRGGVDAYSGRSSAELEKAGKGFSKDVAAADSWACL